IVSGAIAVLLVLVLQDWICALIMLGIVLLVQQAESNLLQPPLLGKAGDIHALGVFLGVAAGMLLAGIPGALVAMPIIAVVKASLLYLAGRGPTPDLPQDKAAAAHFASLGRGSGRRAG